MGTSVWNSGIHSCFCLDDRPSPVQLYKFLFFILILIEYAGASLLLEWSVLLYPLWACFLVHAIQLVWPDPATVLVSFGGSLLRLASYFRLISESMGRGEADQRSHETTTMAMYAGHIVLMIASNVIAIIYRVCYS